MMTGVLPTAVSGKMEKTPRDPKMSSNARVNRAFSPTSPSLTTRFRPGKGVPLAVKVKQKSVMRKWWKWINEEVLCLLYSWFSNKILLSSPLTVTYFYCTAKAFNNLYHLHLSLLFSCSGLSQVTSFSPVISSYSPSTSATFLTLLKVFIV